MPFNVGAIEGSLSLNAKDFIAALNLAQSTLRAFNGAAQNSTPTRSLVERLSSVGNILTGLKSGLDLARGSLNALTAPFLESAHAAGVYQQAVQNLGVQFALAGPGAKALTKDLEAFASKIQDTTAINDVAVLNAAQVLVRYGASTSKLKEYTKAVLDFSTATGQDAVTAAEQFGRTLDGDLGRLGRYLPAAKNLTAEQLKMGGAFAVAKAQLDGFSEASANTIQGSLAQLRNSFEDLQKAIGFLGGPSTQAVSAILKGIAKEAEAFVQSNSDAMKALGGNVLNSTLEGLGATFDALAQVRVNTLLWLADWQTLKAQNAGFFDDIKSGLAGLGGIVEVAFAGVFEKLAQVTGLFLPSISQAFSTAAGDMRAAGDALLDTSIKAAVSSGSGAAAAEALARGYKSAAAEAQKTVGFGAQMVAKAKELVAEQAKAAAAAKEFSVKTSSPTGAAMLEKQRTLYKGIDEHLAAIDAKMDQGTDGLAAMTDGARKLKDAMGEAADAAREVSDASSPSGGEGGGTSKSSSKSDSGFRSGGTTHLNFSDPFAASRQVDVALAQERSVKLAPFNMDVAAHVYTEKVRAYANGIIEAAIAEFSKTVIANLNAAGINDPVKRAKLYKEQLSEAQRLGILPSTR